MSHQSNIKAVYREWAEHQALPPFYHPAWLDLMAGKENWDIVLNKHNNREITGIWPFVVARQFGLKALLNPRLTSYLGPLILDPGQRSETYERLFRQLPGFAMLEQKLHPTNEDTATLATIGFAVNESPTYTISLQHSEEEILKGCKGNTRRRIVKANNELSLEKDRHDFLVNLVEDRLRKPLGNQLPEKTTMKRLFRLIEERQWGRIMVAKKDDELLAGLVVLKNLDDAVYFISSQNDPGKKSGAVTFLIWRAIQWAQAQGLQRFDFEGSSVPGIAKFFRSFGATHQVVNTIRKVNHPLLRAYFAMVGY